MLIEEEEKYLRHRQNHLNRFGKCQGRSLEVRKLISYFRSQNKYILETNKDIEQCPKCQGYIQTDEHMTLVCQDCGFVAECVSVGSEFSSVYLSRNQTPSVKYNQKTHMMTKINIAKAQGPYVLIEIVEKIEDFLDSAYDAISTGIRLDKAVKDLEKAFTGPGKLAKKESASRLLEFKSADDWMTYNRQYGAGNLRELFQQSLSGSARATALMTNFGTNPKAMLDRVVTQLKQEYRGDPEKLEGLMVEVERAAVRSTLPEHPNWDGCGARW